MRAGVVAVAAATATLRLSPAISCSHGRACPAVAAEPSLDNQLSTPKEFDTITRTGYKAFDYVIRRLNALLTG